MMRILLVCSLLLAVAAPPAAAGDGVGINGIKLRLNTRRGSQQKLTYIGKGPSIPVPALNGMNDPRIAGVIFEIFTATGQRNTFDIRTGPYVDAYWRARDGKAAQYKYKNKLAPAGQSFVHKFLLKQNKVILVSRTHELNLLDPQGAMFVRLSIGDQTLCSYFSSPIFDGIIPGRDSDATSFFSRTGTAPENCLDSTIEQMLGIALAD